MISAQELLLCIAWVRKNARPDRLAIPGEDELYLLGEKLLANRIEESVSKMDYWESQAGACEKQLDKLEQLRERAKVK
jgi:hypothetical protein